VTAQLLAPRARQRPALPPRATIPRRAAPALPSFEVTGPAGAPLVIALGGISASCHVVATPGDPSPGWWECVVGPGGAVDTRRWRVLGVDFLDGGRAADGRPARTVTTHDQADALAAVLDAIGETRAHAVIGASYGGMVALAFAERYPERLGRLIVLSAAHESHPMSTGLRTLQRRIVELGLDTGRAADALALARGVAMTTYRTAREFGERFAPAAGFEVERYLEHAGQRFAATYPPERFLALSLSADLHRVDPAAIRVPSVFVAAEGDTLVPESQIAELATRAGGPRRFVRLATRYGHDAFLTEPTQVGRILAAALRGHIATELPA